jgi:hypothetical protein
VGGGEGREAGGEGGGEGGGEEGRVNAYTAARGSVASDVEGQLADQQLRIEDLVKQIASEQAKNQDLTRQLSSSDANDRVPLTQRGDVVGHRVS